MSDEKQNKKTAIRPGKLRLDDCDSAIDDWAECSGYSVLFGTLDNFILSVATRANLRKELQLYLRLRDRVKELEALPFSRERESERRNTYVRMVAIKDGIVRYMMNSKDNPRNNVTPFFDTAFGKGNWGKHTHFIGDESLS